MKNWLKQQATEFTAWMGFALIILAFIGPTWSIVTLGVLLIAIDDQKASAWVKSVSVWASAKIDEYL